MKVKSIVRSETNYPFSLREKARMRGYKIRQLTAVFIPFYARRLIGYSPTLSQSTRLIAGYKGESVLKSNRNHDT